MPATIRRLGDFDTKRKIHDIARGPSSSIKSLFRERAFFQRGP
jgi:hypothetical protein